MFDSDRITRISQATETFGKTATEESNHRIANNLALVASLVRMKASSALKQSEALEPDEVAAMLKEVAQRIEGVAKLHRLLASGPAHDQVVAGPYLSEVCSGISDTFAGPTAIIFRDDSQSLAVAPERLNALGLFLAEGLTNAFKHSHPAGAPGRIAVTFAVNCESGLHLSIQDDGVGLPEGFDAKKDGGLGFRIMRSLSEQLGGDLSIKTNPLGLNIGLNAPTERLFSRAG